MGAWIETCGLCCALNDKQSHPMWVRGLKLPRAQYGEESAVSHPMWVRGLKPGTSAPTRYQVRRTPCGCVD